MRKNYANSRKNEENPSNEQEQPQLPDIWEVLKVRKEEGKWDGEIEVLPIKEYDLTRGTHYYELDSNRQRTIICTLCPIPHGGVLEAHLLSRYTLKNGILYLDGLPRTRAPERKRIDKRRRKKDTESSK